MLMTAEKYEQETSSSPSIRDHLDLADVFLEHINWYSVLNQAFFYQGKQSRLPEPPHSFHLWLEALVHRGLSEQPAILRLKQIYGEMIQRAESLGKLGTNPSHEAYDSFSTCFRSFLTQLRRVEKAFQLAESNIDPLTGLRSRHGMREDLEREYERFRRTNKTFCIAICDIDHFKQVNDRYGHKAGDLALIHIAAAISSNIRAFDEAYRMGGEEFLICLKEADTEIGSHVLERLRAYIEAHPLTLDDGTQIDLTASFGLVEAHQKKGLQTIIDMSDKALYRAKRGGRNRVHAMQGFGLKTGLNIAVPKDSTEKKKDKGRKKKRSKVK